ncbi:MAG: hypothetical protein LBR22_05935 [Desulfovibrio sp.]|nr:hypothetical protein [Desulfovibrio sp.]
MCLGQDEQRQIHHVIAVEVGIEDEIRGVPRMGDHARDIVKQGVDLLPVVGVPAPLEAAPSVRDRGGGEASPVAQAKALRGELQCGSVEGIDLLEIREGPVDFLRIAGVGLREGQVFEKPDQRAQEGVPLALESAERQLVVDVRHGEEEQDPEGEDEGGPDGGQFGGEARFRQRGAVHVPLR